MSNHFLQQIWRQAEISLINCQKIVFCGYSFPDADIHIKYLLKRMEVNRGVTPDIFVVNDHAKKTKAERAQEEIRYKRFFKNKGRVQYLKQSFEDFCVNGLKP